MKRKNSLHRVFVKWPTLAAIWQQQLEVYIASHIEQSCIYAVEDFYEWIKVKLDPCAYKTS